MCSLDNGPDRRVSGDAPKLNDCFYHGRLATVSRYLPSSVKKYLSLRGRGLG